MDKKYILPFLYANLLILNIFDKAITYAVLKNIPADSGVHELNGIVGYFIGKFGLLDAMILYTFAGFIAFIITYKIVTWKRLTVEKNNMSPETIFTGLNIAFYFVVINNIYWLIR
jgi:hypothetical protein